MLFIGADPDLHTSALAAVDSDGHVVALEVFRSKGETGREAVVEMAKIIAAFGNQVAFDDQVIAVESQEIYRGAGQKADTKNPDDLLCLATVSGVLLGMLQGFHKTKIAYLPKPKEWKGDVPKAIHQARTCTKLEWGYKQFKDHCVPTDFPDNTLLHVLDIIEKIRQSDWKHVLDAIGLALWAKDKYEGKK